MAKTKPHAKVHLSVRYHIKTADVWADLRKRGMLVEIWRMAVEQYAPKRADKVWLRAPDRLAITCATTLEEADSMLSELLRDLKYKCRKYPNRWDVTIRNLAEKHGIGASNGEPKTDHKSPNKMPKKEERREKKKEKRKAPESSPATRARSVWPRLVDRAKRHGGRWASTPGANQIKIIAERIKHGATDEQLERAVEGYIRRHGTEAKDGFDPMKHFTASTIFRASKFDANVEGSYLDPPKAKRETNPHTETATQKRDRIAREQLRAQVAAERAQREAEADTEDPESIGQIIDIALGSKARA